ncbi:MAG: phosphoribosyl-AMP cyclohydrolase, partial [Candidatus Omnitrophota bacterium]
QFFKQIKFDQQGLIPAIIQDAKTRQVIMVAYMNELALRQTLASGLTHFWSRSRRKLWMKGESSGHTQKVRAVYFDCDNDAVVIKVSQKSAACHTGYYSCFYKQLNLKTKSVKETGKKIFDPQKVYRKKK